MLIFNRGLGSPFAAEASQFTNQAFSPQFTPGGFGPPPTAGGIPVPTEPDGSQPGTVVDSTATGIDLPSDTPWYQRPIVLIGIALAGIVGYTLYKRA